MTAALREAIKAVREDEQFMGFPGRSVVRLCDEAERAADALDALRQRAEKAEAERDRLRELARRVLALEGTWEQLKADAKKEGIE